MMLRWLTGAAVALGVALPTMSASAAGTIANYLRDGWEIKTTLASSGGISAAGVILQKSDQVVLCPISVNIDLVGGDRRIKVAKIDSGDCTLFR